MTPTARILPFALDRHSGRPIVAPEVGRLPAVAGEGRVERAVRVVAGEREVPGADSADGDDLAVALERHRVRLTMVPEVGRLPAVAGEGRIRRAVRVVAGEREVGAEAAGESDRYDLAVRLDRHPARRIVAFEVGRLLAVPGEARVERAVGVVADEREVVGGAADRDDLAVWLEHHPVRRRRRSWSSACRPRRSSCRACRWGCSERARSAAGPLRAPGGDDLAVRLDRHRVRSVDAPEVGRLPAVAGEGRVERAVRVVAGEREVGVAEPLPPPTTTILPSPWSATPRGSAAAPEVGRLHTVPGEARVERCRSGCSGPMRTRSRRTRRRPRRSCRSTGSPLRSPRPRAPEVRCLLAVAGEAQVVRAVGVVASEREVAREAHADDADRDDPAVRLDRHPGRIVEVPEVGRLPAVAGEARVQRAVRVVAGDRESGASAAHGDDPAIRLDSHPGRVEPAKSVVCKPSPEKVGSSEPSGL